MEGTNVEAGRRLLKESGLNLIVAETMKEGPRSDCIDKIKKWNTGIFGILEEWKTGVQE